MAPLATDMYLPALPVMQVDLGVSASVAQLTLTMTMLGMAVGQMLMGPLSDRYGRKRPLLLGMLGFTAAAVGCAAAESVPLFLAFRFLMGSSGARGIVIARAIARDVCKGPELTRFFAVLMLVNGLAPIAAPVIGGQILRFGLEERTYDAGRAPEKPFAGSFYRALDGRTDNGALVTSRTTVVPSAGLTLEGPTRFELDVGTTPLGGPVAPVVTVEARATSTLPEPASALTAPRTLKSSMSPLPA